MSSGAPLRNAAVDGDARRLFRVRTSACRSFAGKNVSRGSAPTLANDGVATAFQQRLEGGRLPLRPEGFHRER